MQVRAFERYIPLMNASLMMGLVNFIFHIIKILFFDNKLAFIAGGAFLKSFSICFG